MLVQGVSLHCGAQSRNVILDQRSSKALPTCLPSTTALPGQQLSRCGPKAPPASYLYIRKRWLSPHAPSLRCCAGKRCLHRSQMGRQSVSSAIIRQWVLRRRSFLSSLSGASSTNPIASARAASDSHSPGASTFESMNAPGTCSMSIRSTSLPAVLEYCTTFGAGSHTGQSPCSPCSLVNFLNATPATKRRCFGSSSVFIACAREPPKATIPPRRAARRSRCAIAIESVKC